MKQHTNFNIIGNSKWWYILSAALIIPGIISLFVWGLRVGIDFKGGSLMRVSFSESRPAIEDLRSDADSVIAGALVQTSEAKEVLVRFPNSDKVAREVGNQIIAKFQARDAAVTQKSFESIGGSVAKSTTNNAVWAVVITSIALIIFIASSFSGVPKPTSSWRFGVSAILALAHDLLFVAGAFSIIGHFIPEVEVDALFITALLTILGFSVNDTIVVFDRIRENLRRTPGKSFADIANSSLNQTLARSLNTSMTVLIILLSLLLLGGTSIRNFILALTLGVAVGTYSSIFNASPVLVTWQNYVDKKASRKPVPIKKK